MVEPPRGLSTGCRNGSSHFTRSLARSCRVMCRRGNRPAGYEAERQDAIGLNPAGACGELSIHEAKREEGACRAVPAGNGVPWRTKRPGTRNKRGCRRLAYFHAAAVVGPQLRRLAEHEPRCVDAQHHQRAGQRHFHRHQTPAAARPISGLRRAARDPWADIRGHQRASVQQVGDVNQGKAFRQLKPWCDTGLP